MGWDDTLLALYYKQKNLRTGEFFLWSKNQFAEDVAMQ